MESPSLNCSNLMWMECEETGELAKAGSSMCPLDPSTSQMDAHFWRWMEASAKSCGMNQNIITEANHHRIAVNPVWTWDDPYMVGFAIFFMAESMNLDRGDHTKFIDAGINGPTWLPITARELERIGIRQGMAIRHVAYVKEWMLESYLNPPAAAPGTVDPRGLGAASLNVELVLQKLLNVDGAEREMEVELSVLYGWVRAAAGPFVSMPMRVRPPRPHPMCASTVRQSHRRRLHRERAARPTL